MNSDARFPTTQWSLVVRLRGEEGQREEALREICRRYWLPLFTYCRLRGLTVEDAEDATQGFFEQLLRREVFERMEGAAQGRMRSFLLSGIQNWLAKGHRRRTAAKRGGLGADLSLDFAMAEGLSIAALTEEVTPEVMFERRWAETLLLAARKQLQTDYEAAGKGDVFRVLAPHLAGDDPSVTMAELAEQLQVTEGHTRVLLHRLRKHYSVALRDEIALTVDTEEAVEVEMRHLRQILLG